jgi:AhpD family alkylhydroperoxidase
MPEIRAVGEGGAGASDAEGRALLDALRGQYGDSLPEAYAYMAHRPAALRAFSDFVWAVMAGDALPYKYKELAYLKASLGVECASCVADHTAYAAGTGYTPEQLAAIAEGEPGPLFDEAERAILRFADHYTRRPGPAPEGLVAELRRFFSEAQVVELTLVVGLSNTFGRFQNALGIHAREVPHAAASGEAEPAGDAS